MYFVHSSKKESSFCFVFLYLDFFEQHEDGKAFAEEDQHEREEALQGPSRHQSPQDGRLAEADTNLGAQPASTDRTDAGAGRGRGHEPTQATSRPAGRFHHRQSPRVGRGDFAPTADFNDIRDYWRIGDFISRVGRRCERVFGICGGGRRWFEALREAAPESGRQEAWRGPVVAAPRGLWPGQVSESPAGSILSLRGAPVRVVWHARSLRRQLPPGRAHLCALRQAGSPQNRLPKCRVSRLPQDGPQCERVSFGGEETGRQVPSLWDDGSHRAGEGQALLWESSCDISCRKLW